MTEAGWVTLATYPAPIGAEMDKAILEEEGIPVLVKGPVTGIFGPGFAGPTSQGATLLVPAAWLDTARELLGLSADGPADSEQEA